jgi:uncharacterized protein DUF5317
VVAILMGWGLGGALQNLAHVRVGLWWVYPGALALQVVPIPHSSGGTERFLPFAVLVFSYVALIGVTAVNWRLRGFPAILVGLLLNLVPIAVNQGMPVSGKAVLKSGGSIRDVPRGEGQKHHLETPQDELTFLADVIPIRPPFREVVSVGDLVMYLGAGYFLAAAMLARPERRPRTFAVRRRRARPSTTWESPP